MVRHRMFLGNVGKGVLGLVCWGALLGAAAAAAESKSGGMLLAPPTAEVARAKTAEWITLRGVVDPALLSQIDKLWKFDESPTAETVLERVVQSFSIADPETQLFVSQLGLPQTSLIPPEARILTIEELGPFYLANMRLYYARYLAHREMFEEALEMLNAADLKEAVDPASLLFIKAGCEKRLSLRKEGLATLQQLLTNTEGVPVRYSTVAALMRYDLEALEEKSLDDISWKMEDVERRLKLARAGEKVQRVEGEIISLLDELIKKIEEQSGGGGGGGAQNNNNQPSSPAPDAVVKGATAPGKVDPKKFKQTGNWGNLKQRDRDKVKNLLSRDFPAHYRQAIEEYFKKLATREANDSNGPNK